MRKKIALFAFNGDPMCFVHVLLNALDMKERGHDPKIVIEGSATKLIPDLVKKDNPMFQWYEKVRNSDLIDGVCMACSNKMGTLEAAKAQGLRLLNEMNGHPSIGRYLEEGYEVVTFG